MLGLLITTIYYRMNPQQKLAFSIGVPFVLFIGLPVFDRNMTGGRITAALFKTFNWWMGCAMNPASDFATHLVLAALLAGLILLLVRRAEVKQ
jgi:uncharacterized protein involved in cysteine biosynthesis